MEWPEDLLRIFDDPLFSNVHPRPTKPTAADREKEGFMEICNWSRDHQKRAPRINSDDMQEWRLARRLKGIVDDDARRERLRNEDEYNLLDTVYDE